jgi:hypothetical protein
MVNFIINGDVLLIVFLLKNSHFAYVHVSHVMAIELQMLLAQHRVQGNDHVYLLPNHVLKGINDDIKALEWVVK